MIHIQSSIYDYSTNEVVDWLIFFNAKWERWNGEDLNNIRSLYEWEIITEETDKPPVEGCHIGWYRRTHSFYELRREMRKIDDRFTASQAISFSDFYKAELARLLDSSNTVFFSSN